MSELFGKADIMRGPIADDRLVPVMNMFFGGNCTAEALVAALSECSLGTQYAAKTELACSRIIVLNESRIKENDRVIEEQARNFSLKGEEAHKRATSREMRRKGRYLDELVEDLGQCLGKTVSSEPGP